MLALLFFLLLGSTIHVPADYTTIQGAINSSSNGDTISVASGTYHENIDFLGKGIVVIGHGPDSTEINGGLNGSVVTFINGEDSSSVLCGFSIQNGLAPYNGSVGWTGGGIFIENSSPYIECCSIRNNFAFEYSDYNTGVGAGVWIYNSEGTIFSDCNISDNKAEMKGGGLACGYSILYLLNCTITGNYSGFTGGGLYISTYSTCYIYNSIFWDNYAEDGYHDIVSRTNSAVIIDYSDLNQDNIEGTGFTIGNNMINADPLFMSYYHLSRYSPCRDAGSNTYILSTIDIDGQPRIMNSIVDMGSDEFTFLLPFP